MLTISKRQMLALETAKTDSFVRRAVQWLQEHYPEECKRSIDPHAFVRGVTDDLAAQRITSEYSVLYIAAGCVLLRSGIRDLPEEFSLLLDPSNGSQRERSESFLRSVLEHLEANGEEAS